MVAACGVQLSHALFLVAGAIVTASVTITMIAALMSRLLLTINTVVSKITMCTKFKISVVPKCMWMVGAIS